MRWFRVATLLSALWASAPTALAQEPVRPNVLVILADDLGHGDLGSYGAKSIRTPRLDRLAAEGARFTDFYVAHPYCTPTRAALLTGRYPIRSGLTGVLWPHSTGGIAADEVTLSELLQARGYATGLFGKWHLGGPESHSPLDHGFDRWWGMPWPNDQDEKHIQAARHGWGPLPLYDGRRLVERPAVQETLTRRYTDEALRFIDQAGDRPWFVFLSHSMPHLWLAASERFRGRSAHGLYGDVVEELDFETGRLLDALETSGAARRTIVVFLSDNGPVLTHPQLDPNDPHGSAGPLRGGKTQAWEGGVRVPCLARWPGVTRPGSVIRDPAMVFDWFTTVLAASGPSERGPPVPPLDGRDLRPLLAGTGSRGGDELFFFDQQRVVAVRSGRWKLLRAKPAGPAGGMNAEPRPTWLADLEADPGEQRNLAETHPEIVARLEARMTTFVAELGPVREPQK